LSVDYQQQLRDIQQGRNHPPTGPHPLTGPANKFPLKWPILWGYPLFGCFTSGLIIFSAVVENHAFAPLFVLFGGCVLLAMLATLPATLTVDQQGLHQDFFLGLLRRSIPKEEIAGYREAKRLELIHAGLLGWKPDNPKLRYKGDYERVVWVGSTTANPTRSRPRFILHMQYHANRKGFVEALLMHGIQPFRSEAHRTGEAS
jgi:hypothetical protein